MPAYHFSRIEKKWQRYWDDHKTFRTLDFVPDKPKFYALDMFPYPSGAGLHVGHPEGYTATDILCRYRRMLGHNVLHPMGWDAFGLPAEQYAIKTGTHPRDTTQQNINNFRRQIKSLGFSYDWDREVDTTDPHYYRWPMPKVVNGSAKVAPSANCPSPPIALIQPLIAMPIDSPIVLKCLSTGALLWEPCWPTRKSRKVSPKSVTIQ